MSFKSILCIFVFFTFFQNAVAAEDIESSLKPSALKLRKLIQQNCSECHVGVDREESEAFDFLSHLGLNNYINNNDPKKTKLYKQIDSGEMPEEEFGDSLNEVERNEFRDAILAWIKDGAPSLAGEVKLNQLEVNNNEYERIILKDVNKRQNRESIRYFSLENIKSNPSKSQDIETYVKALNKLLNSLSWNPEILKVEQVVVDDKSYSIYAIDIEELGWDIELWEKVVGDYPYTNFRNNELINTFKTNVPVIRADWFVFTASKTPLYEDLLWSPAIGAKRDLSDVLDFFGIDLDLDEKFGHTRRAGFAESGVSFSNRVIERHPHKFGAFWLSYDFSSSLGLQNIFEHPLGPELNENVKDLEPFKHEGGEIIFNMPNGTQAYILVDSKGKFLDGPAPINIVRDRNSKTGEVINGISCMSCHAKGIIEASDEIANHYLSSFTSSKELKSEISSIYQPNIEGWIAEDAERFVRAMAQIDITTEERYEPILYVSKAYEQKLTVIDFISEIVTNNTERDFLSDLLIKENLGGRDSDFDRFIPATLVTSGTADRELFEANYLATRRYLEYNSSGDQQYRPDLIGGLYVNEKELHLVTQMMLKELGYGRGAKFIDGDFGPQSQTALKNALQDLNLDSLSGLDNKNNFYDLMNAYFEKLGILNETNYNQMYIGAEEIIRKNLLEKVDNTSVETSLSFDNEFLNENTFNIVFADFKWKVTDGFVTEVILGVRLRDSEDRLTRTNVKKKDEEISSEIKRLRFDLNTKYKNEFNVSFEDTAESDPHTLEEVTLRVFYLKPLLEAVKK